MIDVVVAVIQPLYFCTRFGADNAAAAIIATDFSAGVKKGGDLLAALVVDGAATFMGAAMAQFDKCA